MRIIDVEQGSDEWRLARLGKVGASMVADVTARTKTGWGASRKNLHAQLVAERLTGRLTESFTNAAMQWGVEKEPEARDAYAFVHGVTVQKVGLVLHPNIDMACASPDGMAGDDGLVEIKCPNTATHIATLLGSEIDGGYVKQMQWQMACTGRRWCDFVSYDPRMPSEMQLHVRRVVRDDEMIRQLDTYIAAFLREVEETVSRLQRQYQVSDNAIADTLAVIERDLERGIPPDDVDDRFRLAIMDMPDACKASALKMIESARAES